MRTAAGVEGSLAATPAAATGDASVRRPLTVCADVDGGRRLAGLNQPRDRLADRDDVARLCGDAGENAVARSLDFDDRLVGLDLEEHFALADLLAFLASATKRACPLSCAISSAGITTLTAISFQRRPFRERLLRVLRPQSSRPPADSAAPRSRGRSAAFHRR